MTTLHEWKCPVTAKAIWLRTAPPKPYDFVKRMPLCPSCKVPHMVPTGQRQKRYSLKELALYGIPPAPADRIRKITGEEFLKLQTDGAHTVHTATLQAVTDPKHGWHPYVVEVIETGRYYAVMPRKVN